MNLFFNFKFLIFPDQVEYAVQLQLWSANCHSVYGYNSLNKINASTADKCNVPHLYPILLAPDPIMCYGVYSEPIEIVWQFTYISINLIIQLQIPRLNSKCKYLLLLKLQ